jgi:lactoylglutathione lyase/glyoxylase I family protein
MRTAIVFLIGLFIGSAIVPGLAQGDRSEEVDFYTRQMGFREAFTIRNDQGQPTLAYVQASRNSFIELQQANANRAPGLNHYGLHVQNLEATVAGLKARGVTVEDIRVRPDDSSVANATDPNGIRIELFEFGPGSSQGKAIASWR